MATLKNEIPDTDEPAPGATASEMGAPVMRSKNGLESSNMRGVKPEMFTLFRNCSEKTVLASEPDTLSVAPAGAVRGRLAKVIVIGMAKIAGEKARKMARKDFFMTCSCFLSCFRISSGIA